MALHRTSGRRGLGVALAFTTMALWATLPLALQPVVAQIDALTITWARFSLSAVVLCAVLLARRDVPPLRGASATSALLLAAATCFLAVNYAGFLIGLDHTSAADSQVLIQMGPILLSLGGIVVFRERVTAPQWLGFGVLAIGLALFIGGRFANGHGAPRQLEGTLILVVAAITWAIYGLAQKQLLRSWSSAHVLLCVYVGCALLFSFVAEPSALAGLDETGIWLLLYCSLNTVVGYGAFAESLAHWEASRVGAVLALTPLGTLGLAALLEAAWPEVAKPLSLSAASWLGVLLVVAGSLAASLAADNSS